MNQRFRKQVGTLWWRHGLCWFGTAVLLLLFAAPQLLAEELEGEIDPGHPLIEELEEAAEPEHLHAEELRISGATTLQPLVEQLAEVHASRSGIRIYIEGGGSGKGIAHVLEGVSDLGMVSRDLRSEEKAKLHNKLVGLDALCFILNPSVGIMALSRSQVQDLYSGRVKNWAQLGGPDLPVVLVSKELGRATLDLFEGYAMMHHPGRKEPGSAGYVSRESLEIGSNLEAMTLVAGIPGAVGYVSYGSAMATKARGMAIIIVASDGVAPSHQAILDGSFPIRRGLNLVYAHATPAILDFLAAFDTPEGFRLVEADGFIPAR